MKFFNTEHKYKVPVIQQLTQYECGISCLKMILSYYKKEVSMNEIRKYYDSNMNGISLLNLKEVAIKMGLNASVKKINTSTVFKLGNIEPIILSWQGKHYVILEKVMKSYCCIIDPNFGRVKISYEDFEKSFSNYIILLEPSEKFEKSRNNNDVKRYLNKMLIYKKSILMILILTLLLQFISILTPTIISNIIDSIIVENILSISTFIGVSLAVVVTQVLITYLKNKLIITFQKKIDYSLLFDFVNHMIRLPYKFFQLRTCGDLIQRLSSNGIIRDILIQKLIPGFMNIILVFVIFFYMFIQSKLIAGIVLLLAIIQLVVILAFKQKMKYLTQSQVIAQTESNSYLTEMIKGIGTVKTLNLEKDIVNEWNEKLKNQVKRTSEKSMFQTNIDLITNTIIYFSPLFVVLIGISQVKNNTITIGQLFAFQSLTLSFLNPINFLATIINDLLLMVVLLERIYDVLDEKTEEIDEGKFKKLQGNIKVKNLSFRYSEDSNYVLKDISLDINAGEKVAIVGESGCGKSTLALILCGLYSPVDGEIKFDNKLYNNSLKRNFGVVMQDNFLFNKTIYENISIGLKEVSADDVKAAVKIAGLSDKLSSLPLGFNTLLAESGTNLSGGEKQRLSIARAIVRKPSILVLDEATSALDSLTESMVMENIKAMNCTQVIIAHRLSTIQDSDKIIVLRNGSIVDIGTHNELMSNCEYYKTLYSKSTLEV